jgi:hypothetical protein
MVSPKNYYTIAVPQAQHSNLDLKTPVNFGTQRKYVDLHYKIKDVVKKTIVRKLKLRKLRKSCKRPVTSNR